MRFVWLRENAPNGDQIVQSTAEFATMVAYNAIWWIPIVFSFVGIIDYSTGFNWFAAVTVVRAGANLYRNNLLQLETAAYFPLRAP